MRAQTELLNPGLQGSLVQSSSVWGIWCCSGSLCKCACLEKYSTYPPPTNDIHRGLNPSLEVLPELLAGAHSSMVLLLEGLNSVVKEGTTVAKQWFLHRRSVCLDISTGCKLVADFNIPRVVSSEVVVVCVGVI